jgi:hypothetical protein
MRMVVRWAVAELLVHVELDVCQMGPGDVSSCFNVVIGVMAWG